jgi:hypothetical protein
MLLLSCEDFGYLPLISQQIFNMHLNEYISGSCIEIIYCDKSSKAFFTSGFTFSYKQNSYDSSLMYFIIYRFGRIFMESAIIEQTNLTI